MPSSPLQPHRTHALLHIRLPTASRCTLHLSHALSSFLCNTWCVQGYYFTGDGCRRDADGYYWITGRVDDVINVSGHRVGTAEVESSLTSHDACAEAAVIG